MGASNPLLGDLLKNVSRSFYTTLRILPGKIRDQIGLAYLLARTSDTIADTNLVAPEARLNALRSFRDGVSGTGKSGLQLGELAERQSSEAERVLLRQTEASLALLEKLSPPDLTLVRQVLEIIISGQELDLERFSAASKDNLIALRNDSELDDYTWRVAGCVGEFWTKMCRAHLFPHSNVDDHFLLTHGVRFGKGLQLVNILRDVPVDLRNGRCYMPSERLASAGLSPSDLLEPSAEPRLRSVYGGYLDLAESHLRAGWAYTNALPRGSVRVRLACAWPNLIGFETLRLLRTRNVLDPKNRIKISRQDVKRIIRRTVFLYPFAAAWKRLAPSGPNP
jgi:farnesyl-diphosphate farnesyltransferase